MQPIKLFLTLMMLLASACAYTYSSLDLTVSEDGSLSLSGTLIHDTTNQTKAYLLGPSESLTIDKATLAGKTVDVFLDEKGYYLYTNQAGEVKMSGKVLMRDQVPITVLGPASVLTITTPAYAETVYSAINKRVVLYSYTPVSQPVHTANIMIERQKIRFEYRTDLDTFQTVKLPLLNGESIAAVDGGNYEMEGNTLIIYPKALTVRVTGFLDQLGAYTPPAKGYVVLQWDPVLSVTANTAATEVDISQVPGFESAFSTRKAYYSYDDGFTISYKKMDSFPSLVFAVSSEQITSSITENGWLIHDSSLSFSNTGVDYLTMGTAGWTPLYLGVNGPQYLTREGDNLKIAVPKDTYGNMDLISMQKAGLSLIDLKTITYPTVEYPISDVSARLYYPDDYWALPLRADAFSFDWAGQLLVLLFIAGTSFAVMKDRRTAAAYTVALYLLLQVSLVFLVLHLAALVYLVFTRATNKWAKYGLAAAGVLLVLAIGTGVLIMGFSASAPDAAPSAVRYETSGMKALDMAAMPVAAEAGFVTREEILPVQLTLPTYGKWIDFDEKFLATGEAPSVTMVFVHSWLLTAMLLVAAGAVLGASKPWTKLKMKL